MLKTSLLALICLAAFYCSSQEATASRPNIVLIMADDQGGALPEKDLRTLVFQCLFEV